MKEKNKGGRPPMRPSDRKDKVITLRMTRKNYETIKKRYGAIQIFFDLCITDDKEGQL